MKKTFSVRFSLTGCTLSGKLNSPLTKCLWSSQLGKARARCRRIWTPAWGCVHSNWAPELSAPQRSQFGCTKLSFWSGPGFHSLLSISANPQPTICSRRHKGHNDFQLNSSCEIDIDRTILLWKCSLGKLPLYWWCIDSVQDSSWIQTSQGLLPCVILMFPDRHHYLTGVSLLTDWDIIYPQIKT